MTKAELIAAIAERSGVAKTDVEKSLKGFEEVVQQVVAKGSEKLTIPGFLSFEQTHRAARTGRNPQTGEAIQVKATKAVKVSAGATLKNVAKGTVKPPK
jgi:DNA-binding protein HU-beta